MPTTPTPETLIRPEIRALCAYHVPQSQGLIKLDAMENPYDWPTELVADWLDRLRAARINRYPDPDATALKQRLRASMGIPPDSGLILGNGSDELIQLIVMALASPGRTVLAPEPSFVMYRMVTCFAGLNYVSVPLRAPDFELDTTAMLAAIERHHPAVVFLAYPNNPTGNLFDAEAILQIIAAAPGLVVVDEAYYAFTEYSFLSSLPRYDNLLVMRTLSKIGLAGLRVGFLTGASRWLQEFEKLRLPYNINVLSQMSAEFLLSHHAVLDAQTKRIRADRARLLAALTALPGVTAYPSEANFILLRLAPGQGDRTTAALLESGILVKNLGRADPLLSDCLRVTVGLPEENQAFILALKSAL